VAFEFVDDDEAPVYSVYTLEFPDGKIERGELDEGRIFKDKVPRGRYRALLVRLDVEWDDGAIVIRHQAFAPGVTAKVSVWPAGGELGGDEPLWKTEARLSEGGLHELETRVAFDEASVDRAQRLLGLTVEADGHLALAAEPLLRAPPDEEEAPAPFVAFEVRADDEPVESSCVLQLADGRVERAKLENGALVKKDAGPGVHRLHLPALLEARWCEERIEWPAEGEGRRRAKLTLRHIAMEAGRDVRLTLHERHLEEEPPLAEKSAPLRVDEAALARAQEASFSFELPGDLPPGRSRWFTFVAEVDGLRMACKRPLELARAAASPAKSFVAFHLDGDEPPEEALLEHPDGRCENVRLENGRLRREGVADGSYRLHVPSLLAVRCQEKLELPGTLDVSVWTAALSGRVEVSVHLQHLEFSGEPPLARAGATLTMDKGEPCETHVRCELAAPPVAACRLVIKAEAGGHVLCSAPIAARRRDHES
jgi:hypothetical protein